MDTSKEYIKMCEKAVEIHEIWKPARMDYTWAKDRGVRDVIVILPHKRSCIWLPRQDQLQEMFLDEQKDCFYVPSHDNRGCFHWLAEIMVKGIKCGDFGNNITYPSGEKLWLAFVMKEKYNKIWKGNKIWDSENWIKEK